jgi:hypothetical protein
MADRLGRREVALGTLALSCALAGCASLAPRTTPGRSTALMEAEGAKRSAIDIRQRVDSLVPVMMDFVERTADGIRAETSDAGIRRRALELKIELVPVIYEAGFQTDPLAAGLDLWLLMYQLEGCLDAGTGPCDFGPQQATARTAVQQQREALEQLFQAASLNPAALERERQLVQDAARRHPLQDQFSLRRRSSITTELASTLRSESLDPFELIGDVSVTLTSLSNRLNLYLEEAARLARWHAELLAEEVVGWPTVDGAFGDIGRASASIDRVSRTLEPAALERLLDRPLAAIGDERRAALEDVNRQRLLTLDYVTDERKALVDTLVASLTTAVQSERVAVLADIRKERLETLQEIERLRRDLIADSAAQGRQLVDHIAWRLAQLLAGGLLLGAVLIWAVRRSPRHPAADR